MIFAAPPWYVAATAAPLLIIGGLGLLSVDGLAVLLTGSSGRDDADDPRCRMNGVVTIAARIIVFHDYHLQQQQATTALTVSATHYRNDRLTVCTAHLTVGEEAAKEDLVVNIS